MRKSSALDRREVEKRTVCIPKPLRIVFGRWLLENGFIHQKKPSFTKFVKALQGEEWYRGKEPIPKANGGFEDGRASMGLSDEHFEFLQRGVAHFYKSWGHFIQDVIAGNWLKKEDVE